jgi:hypothetical protein
MLRHSAVTIGLMLAALATAASSQEPRGRGRGPGGFMFGGPGGPNNSAVMLLGMREVQQELAVTDNQRKQIDELMRDVQAQMRASFGAVDFQDLATLTEEQRVQRFDEARKKADEANRAADEKLSTILDAKQTERMNQLRLQREGITAFIRPDIAKRLGLNDEQLAKIREIEESLRPPFGGPGGPAGPGGFGGPPDFAQVQAQRQKARAGALTVLTDSQRDAFAKMTGKEFIFPEPQFGFGPGGPSGRMGQEQKIVNQFDKDGDGRLNRDERIAARESLKSDRALGRGVRGFGPPGGGPGFTPLGGGPGGGPPGGRPGFGPPGFGRGNAEPPKPGKHLSPSDVKSFPDATLYEPTVLRTLFLTFENDDWEAELQEFHGTDVEIPATLTVDGREYPNVGVHFRGMSSYMGVPAGYKRSLNLSIDFADSNQRLCGYKTLNLLNGHGDASFMSSVLYSHIARQHMPAPRANFVRVVINGESWGVYANVQQFDKIFLAENFKTTKGARWKVSGNPGADGGLRYLGDNIDEYRRRFEIKSGDSEQSWRSLIALCRTLNETPLEQLEAALEPILDLDSLLWFLALDVALINNDGYWTRASDYSIFLDERGKFHIVPHDMNEAFHGAMMFGPGGPGGGPGGPPGGPGGFPGAPRGPGGFDPPDAGPSRKRGRDAGRPGDDQAREGNRRPAGEPGRGADRAPGGLGPGGLAPGGGRGAGSVELDPLVGLNNARTPLRSRILAVPSLRAKYVEHVRAVAESSLDWKNLGPVVAQFRELIVHDVESDTRKLQSFDAFQRTTADETISPGARGRELPLRAFADQRRKYLLDYQMPAEPSNSPERSR